MLSDLGQSPLESPLVRRGAGTPCLSLRVPPQVLATHILGGYVQVEHGEPCLIGGVARDDESRRCTIVRANEQLGGLAVLAEAARTTSLSPSALRFPKVSMNAFE